MLKVRSVICHINSCELCKKSEIPCSVPDGACGDCCFARFRPIIEAANHQPLGPVSGPIVVILLPPQCFGLEQAHPLHEA